MDPEINHGINDLITGFGFVLVTEDAVVPNMDKQPRHVLNQWTYHARMYNAARYVCTQPDMAFLQLVSFGCGVDAITTDELRSILEEGGDLYTQLKIDDISNLGPCASGSAASWPPWMPGTPRLRKEASNPHGQVRVR